MEPWRAPLWFSPSPDGLGYNDGYLMFGLVHALFRWGGVDPFMSAELVTLVLRAVGFPGFLLLARHVMRLRFWPALAGAAVFTMANNAVMQIDHAQLVTVSLAPWLWWLLGRFWHALEVERRGASLAWGIAMAALLSAWLMTAFYTLWFTAFFLCILGAIGAAGVARQMPRLVAWPVAASLVALAAGTVPFLLTYLPTRHETGGHQFDEVLGFAPQLWDYVDLGAGNLLWGQLAGAARLSLGWTMAGVAEHVVGWPPVLLATAVAGALTALRRRRWFWVALAAATVLAVLLPVAWGSQRWTAWRLVYALVPGASAIRSTTRFALVLTLPVTLLAAYALDTVRAPFALLAGLAAVLVLEEVNVTRKAEWPRARYVAELDIAPPPAGQCSRFIVQEPRDPNAPQPSILMNTEAMLVAERVHLPTLNGHASFHPKYEDLSYTHEAEYEARMATVAMRAGVTRDLCKLDLRSGDWSRFTMPDAGAPLLGQPYRLTDNAAEGFILGRGWSHPDVEGRWTDGPTAVLLFRNPIPDRPLRLTLRVTGYPPASPRAATLSYDGLDVATWYPGSQPRAMVAELPPMPDGVHSVTLRINAPRTPAELGLGPDRRQLGLFVEQAELSDPGR